MWIAEEEIKAGASIKWGKVVSSGGSGWAYVLQKVSVAALINGIFFVY